MATVFRRNKKWGISFVDPSGKRVRRIVSPYKETAVKVLKKIEVQIAEGKYLDIEEKEKLKTPLFSQFAEIYFENHVKIHNRTVKKHRYFLNGLVDYFGNKSLDDIRQADIQQYIVHRSQKIKSSSINRELSLLKSIFNRASEWSYFAGENPTKNIKKFTENNSRCRWLTEEEQSKLLNNCTGTLRLLVLIALKSGMRWGEIVNLKWRQMPNSNYVDLENGVFFVHESLSKSKKSRYVPIAESVKKALMEHPNKNNSGYVFISYRTGKRLKSMRGSFYRELKKIGVDDFTFHDLRHTFASHLVRKGVDLFVVQKLLGHASINMTQRYAHLQPGRLKEAIDKL